MAKIHTGAPSKSNNPLAAAAGFFAAGVLLSAFAFAAVSEPYAGNNASREAVYDNRAGRQILAAQIPAKFTANGPEKKAALSGKVLDNLTAEAVFETKNHLSLTNYFYQKIGLAHPWSAYGAGQHVRGLAFDEQILGEWMAEQGEMHNQTAQDAELEIENDRAIKFAPHKDGRTVDLAKSRAIILSALADGRISAALPVETRSPKIRLGDLNSLGILENISRGQSDFSGSSASRIKNVRVGSSQFNGVIIKPGEEFSFNKNLGTITEAKGYVPELVIKREGVDKELGGGLCQVSSTAFRAAFFGGLPITVRRNHSYAVAYYTWIDDDLPRSVGLDATIYPGAQDMKFINDTPGHILIWTHMAGTRLYFDFYGTKDGRQVAVDGPYEYDRRNTGAVKAKVTRKVVLAGKESEITLTSNYVSPELYPKLYELPKPEPPPVPPAESPEPPPTPPQTQEPILNPENS